MADRDREFLAQLQAMDLNAKFQRTLGLVGEWHNYYDNKVYVSLSGGKDSTVLADIDAKWCKAIGQPLNLVFSNTGLEYPEIQRHVREMKPFFEDRYGIEVNLTIVRPKMQFSEVISKYGYPLIGKEVAEAIYYARRLRSAERERRRRDLRGEWQHEPNTHTHRAPTTVQRTVSRKRAECTGNRANGSVWKSGGRTTSSRRAYRETAEQSSQDECPG